MFAVYDNGKPAKCKDQGFWSNNRFNRLEDAIHYANCWMYGRGCFPEDTVLKDKIITLQYSGGEIAIKEEDGILWQFKAGETCKFNRDLSYVDRLDLDKNGFMTPTCKDLDILVVPTDKAKEVADALNSALGGTIYNKR